MHGKSTDVPKVKICGLRRPEDARVAVRAGADAVGVVFARSPRRVTPEEAKAVAQAARDEAAALGRGGVEVWGVFVNEQAERVAELAREVPLDVAQLHGDESADFARGLAPVRAVKAVRVWGPGTLPEIERLAAGGAFEALVLDAFDERARGGTGKISDWDVAAVAAVHARVVLAGGLGPSNVAEAVRRVRPWMVDASSGVEGTPGEKDAALVEAFVREAKGALSGGASARAGGPMKRAVQFGAGAIGRGFLGQLYSDAGWETVFVDVVPEVIEALNDARGYAVEIVGPGARTIDVRNVRAVDGRDAGAVAEEIARADLVGTSVGQAALPAVAKALAAGVSRRAAERPDSTLDILLCENLLHAAKRMRELIEPHLDATARAWFAGHVGLVETVISRMIPVPKAADPGADPLRVAAEDYSILPVDARAFRGPVPDVPGLLPVANYLAHEERKLYAHNCGHALAAYLGAREGHEFVWQAIEDPNVRPRVEKGLWEAGRALCAKHGFSREEHAAHLDQLLRRFANRALGDTVARVGRDPVRKLGPSDRLVGAARLAVEHGERPEALAEGIAAAMEFRSPGDPSAERLAAILDAGGPERVLGEVCGLGAAGPEGDRLIRDLVLGALARRGRPAP